MACQYCGTNGEHACSNDVDRGETDTSQPFIHRGIVLPEHLRESLAAYANDGRPTGGFIEACIANNLSLAIARADAESLHVLPAIVGYLYNECPSQCWGTPESFTDWINKKFDERQQSSAEVKR